MFLVAARRSLWMRGGLVCLACLLVLGLRLGAGRSRPAAGTLAPIARAHQAGARVALTFDVTYGDVELTKVLRALEAAGVKATFFVSHHWAANHPDLLLSMVQAGHEIGTLGFKMVPPDTIGPEELQGQLAAAQSLLARLLGAPVRFYRPYDGRWNTGVIAAARQAQLLTVTWSVDGGDGLVTPPPVAGLVHRVVGRTTGGDIILLHASDFARHTGDAVPQILRGLQQRGFQPVPVSRLMAVTPAR